MRQHRKARLITAFAAASLFCIGDADAKRGKQFSVSGTGAHLFTTTLLHSETYTDTGLIQRTTDTVEFIEGDLKGRILFHPTTVIDFINGTAVSTGSLVYSGTIAGSEPVLIYDDEFRFDISFIAGTTTGTVVLRQGMVGPAIACLLKVTGTGFSPEGNGLFSYVGTCTSDGNRGRHLKRITAHGNSGDAK